ncbi:MAG: hypothetical protein K6C14_02740 [Eubacterium sp.]|nr:hypothetical protein [Eubacterium sp.]
MKLKRAFSILLALVLMLTCVSASFSALAEELRYFQRGVLTDGEKTAYWIIDKDNKVLYLSGDGVSYANTPDYANADSGPFARRTDVTRIVIEEDVNYVGDYVFANMTSVDTIEIQSNLLKRENSISSTAFSGDTNIRNVQGDSEVLSTNTLVNAVKVGVGVFTGDWWSVVSNIIHTGSDVMADDGTLDDASVDAMVTDYIINGGTVFLGDLDEVVENYEEMNACPCYSNFAYHHQYSEQLVTAPTCTEEGIKTVSCPVCGDTHNEPVEPLGHNYVQEVYLAPTCTARGVMDNYCTRCGDSSFSVIPANGHTEVIVPAVRASCTSTGLTEGAYCSVCGVTTREQEVIPMRSHMLNYTYYQNGDYYVADCILCDGEFTEFDNDISALLEAEEWYNSLTASDYSAASFGALSSVAELHKNLSANDTLNYPQFAIDEEVTEILTRINELQPYVQLRLFGRNAALTYACGEETGGKGAYSLDFGSDVTFTAEPNTGYKFIAWYDVNTKRYLSTSPEFTYKVTSNLILKAVTAPTDYATLTFHGEGGQIKASYSESHDYWTDLEELDDLIPEVPVKYGYTNGRWNINVRTLIELSLGHDVDVYAEYDSLDVVVPDLPAASSDGAPSLTLSYYYNDGDGVPVGTFVMASNVPDGCDVQTIGMAYVKKPAESFCPTDYLLSLNSQVTTARFSGLSDSGLYILNIKKIAAKNSWAVRGYMTYYENGVLKVAYTNQINIINREAV